jgi:hypothetical protein
MVPSVFDTRLTKQANPIRLSMAPKTSMRRSGESGLNWNGGSSNMLLFELRAELLPRFPVPREVVLLDRVVL